MATHRAAKNLSIKPCLLLSVVVVGIIIFLSIFSDSIQLKNSHQVTIPSNYNIQNSMPKQFGSNNNIHKLNEGVKIGDEIKIPAKFAFGEPANSKPVILKEILDLKSNANAED